MLVADLLDELDCLGISEWEAVWQDDEVERIVELSSSGVVRDEAEAICLLRRAMYLLGRGTLTSRCPIYLNPDDAQRIIDVMFVRKAIAQGLQSGSLERGEVKGRKIKYRFTKLGLIRVVELR